MLGRSIFQYQVLEKLGAGGMGEVYKARDTRLNRFVAIKVLTPSQSTSDDRRRRFFQEAQAASALNHPNIITIYDIITDGAVECIVMEYLNGKTLVELIPNGGMQPATVVRLGVQMAAALSAAHAPGIVHRDFKPGNVMVTGSGLVKVLDFGLAKLTNPDPAGRGDETHTVMGGPLTVEGSILGTVSYMSPEQAQGKPVDSRSDIFAFGAVLYEMATGRRAFEGENTLSTLTAVLRDSTPPVADTVPGVLPEFDYIIQRCLRKLPGDRYQSMAEVEAALVALKQRYDSGSFSQAPQTASTSAAARPASALETQLTMSSVSVAQPQLPDAEASLHPREPAPAPAPPTALGVAGHVHPPQPPSAPTSEPPAVTPRPGGGKSRGRLALIGGLAAVLAVAGAGAWFSLRNHSGSPAPPPANSGVAAPQPELTQPVQPAAPAQQGAVQTGAVPPPTPSNSAAGSKPAPSRNSAQEAALPKFSPPRLGEEKIAEATPTPTPTPPAPETVAPPAAVTAAPARSVTLPDGTPFTVTLAEDVPADAEEGLSLHFSVTSDLKVGGAVIIAKGAPVTGVVLEGKRKKVLGIGGKMTLRMLNARTVDGKLINIRATSGRRSDGPPRRSVEVSGAAKSKELAAAKGAGYLAFVDGDVVIALQR